MDLVFCSFGHAEEIASVAQEDQEGKYAHSYRNGYLRSFPKIDTNRREKVKSKIDNGNREENLIFVKNQRSLM